MWRAYLCDAEFIFGINNVILGISDLKKTLYIDLVHQPSKQTNKQRGKHTKYLNNE